MKIFGVFATLGVAVLSVTTQARADNCNTTGYCSSNANSGSGSGVLGGATTGTGVLGNSDSGYGVYGVSQTSRGVFAYSNNGSALHARGINGPGVYGESISTTAGSNGVEGHAYRSGVSGVYGVGAAGGYGVSGRVSPAGAGTAVYGDNTSTSGWAGYFTGRLYVGGRPYSAAHTNFTIFSDARLKKNIKPLDGALDRLLKLRGVTFEWKEPEKHANMTGPQRGFIAQDVETVMPEWVSETADGIKTINTSELDAMVVESLRTLKNENDLLRSQAAKMEGRLKALENARAPSIAGLTERELGLGGILMIVGTAVLSRRKRART